MYSWQREQEQRRQYRCTLKTVVNWPRKRKLKLQSYVTTTLFCPQRDGCGLLSFPLAFDLCRS